ncbi:MAG: DMT family transporter [Paracoccaceae bacterium]
MRETPEANLKIGVFSALGVIAIWSGFVVASRAGVLSALLPYDVAALRFIVAGVVVLPFAHAWWPRHLPLGAQIAMALSGPGAIYSLLIYAGLANASAAFGGVFANGSLPIFTMMLMLALTGERPGRGRIFAVAVIVLGGGLLSFSGLRQGGPDVLTGIAFFLAASATLSCYLVGFRRWGVTPRQALVLVNLPSAAIYLPIWWFFLPSGMAEADAGTIVFQALFQGLGPAFVAVVLIALTARHLGPTPTAGVSATVPAMAAILAVPVLGEIPTPVEWVGIGVVTLGLLLLFRAR